MDENFPLRALADEWTAFLKRHGHCMKEHLQGPDTLVSRNGKGRDYRWILRSANDKSVLLKAAEHKEIRRQLRLARNSGQRAYVVVKFSQPANKVVVVPAVGMLKDKRLASDKGGISWDC